ncbi:hypothetical protein HU675_0050905 (plasmid) [Bradyrhizobium septentrionale]|uniref:hypothetical protein n=1 Tax=Bradyrhizobium septentrionale TaxID=1404411 RepID=UPI0015969DF1|nr:hypothetical protein [Bradyrhizobium septentrionale]UGY30405.1 hypothetical protein HU675_0050905 [Bradyrhizobium septentrionale]
MEPAALASQARSSPSLLDRPCRRTEMASRRVLVFCVGCQHHNSRLKLADLPGLWTGTISPRRLDWGEVINFAKGVSGFEVALLRLLTGANAGLEVGGEDAR